MRANRAFLSARSVRYLARAGIRQFLDLGSGIPTVGKRARDRAGSRPDARIVYVDKDPVAVAHSQVMLEGTARPVWSSRTRDRRGRVAADPVRELLGPDRARRGADVRRAALRRQAVEAEADGRHYRDRCARQFPRGPARHL